MLRPDLLLYWRRRFHGDLLLHGRALVNAVLLHRRLRPWR